MAIRLDLNRLRVRQRAIDDQLQRPRAMCCTAHRAADLEVAAHRLRRQGIERECCGRRGHGRAPCRGLPDPAAARAELERHAALLTDHRIGGSAVDRKQPLQHGPRGQAGVEVVEQGVAVGRIEDDKGWLFGAVARQSFAWLALPLLATLMLLLLRPSWWKAAATQPQAALSPTASRARTGIGY